MIQPLMIPKEVLILNADSVTPKMHVDLCRNGFDTWWDYELKCLWAWR